MTIEPPTPWTVLRLLNWTREYFEKVNMEDARLSAEMLLAHVLGCKRIELYTRFNYEPTKEQLETYRALVARAYKFEPVAYMVGTKEFYSLPFKVTHDVLIPRPETENLATEAISFLGKLGRPSLAWDAFTGSGCVGIAVASRVKAATVLATDISPEAVAVAVENAAANKVDSRVRCRVADMLTLPPDCGDLKDFDVITANPPYVATNQGITETVKHEPSVALWGGKDGTQFIRPLIEQAPNFLRPGGMLAMEFGYGMADAVRDLIVANGQFTEPRILLDHQGIERSAVTLRK